MRQIFIALSIFLISCNTQVKKEDLNQNNLDSAVIDKKAKIEQPNITDTYIIEDTSSYNIVSAGKVLGSFQNDDIFFIAYSKYKFKYPKEYDDSYYFEGVFFNSCNKFSLPLRKSGLFDYSKCNYNNNDIQFNDICSHDDYVRIKKIEIQNQNNRIYFLVSLPVCSEYYDHYIIFKDSIRLDTLLTFESYDISLDVKSKNDSIIYFEYTDRDEIVYAIQNDYYFEYNLVTNKIINDPPNIQYIDWNSKAIQDIVSYNSLEEAKEQNSENGIIILKNSEFHIDTLYRDLNIISIKTKNNQIRFLRTSDLSNKILKNNAG